MGIFKLSFKNRKAKIFYKIFFEMAWYNATGKENDKSLYQERVIDRCKFCGQHKEIKTTMTIVFSEFEQSHGPICKDCYSANAIMVQAK